jgi:hypothetical protein
MNRKAPIVNLFPLNCRRAGTDMLVIFHKGTGTTHNPHRGYLESTQTITDYYGRAGTVNKTAEPPQHTHTDRETDTKDAINH